MLANFGFYLLLLCTIFSIYGFIASGTAAYNRSRNLYISAKYAFTLTGVLNLLAAIILWYGFFDRDFSIHYIAKNSSNDLPILYTFTAFWSSLEGSHFLWTSLLCLVGVVAIWTNSKDNEHIMPYVTATLLAVLGWKYYLLISVSDPFVVNIPAPADGSGMNTLLQNFYMAIHPPMLFIGYVSLAIPFAYTIAALCYGDITQGWLKSVRRWNLFGWCLLTAAVALGGRWAYVELGWAGYWAWDPVENSSFLPWLLSTALMHNLLVQDKLGHLKRMTLIICILAFFLCYFGTFITRSGVISSVHAFGEGEVGINYLIFLVGICFISMVLYGVRAPSILPSETEKVWGVSKESSIVLALFIFLSFTAIVFIGTIFPIATEFLTQQRISIQAPYFNAFAPYIGISMVVIMAIGNLMRYKSGKIQGGFKVFVWSAFLAIPFAVLLYNLGEISKTVSPTGYYIQVIAIYLLSWTLSCLLFDFYYKLSSFQFKFFPFIGRNTAYFGGFIAHIGFLIAIFGFLGNYRGLEKRVVLKANESTILKDYRFTFDKGIQVKEVDNATLFTAPIKVEKNGKHLGSLYSSQSKYPTSDQILNEIGVHGTIWNDLYVVLHDFDRAEGKSATLSIHINPTVRIVWISIFILVIGGFIALADKFRGNRSKDVVAGSWEVG